MHDTEYWLRVIMTFIILSIVGVLIYHQWSDCLGENSFLTCARMLS